MPRSRAKRSPPRSLELLESERRFSLLVEGAVDYAIFMLDPQGVITNWNAGAERIHGYDAAEIVGRDFELLYVPEERTAGLPAQALEAARKEGKFAAQGWRLRKDGSRFLAAVVIDPIHDSGKLTGYAEIIRDVTERQTAAVALHESERQFQLLVGNVTDYALYMLDPDGRIASWNTGGERIKGYSADEIIGQNFSRFYTEADRAAGRPARALAIARETGRYDEEGWRVRKDGSYFWASVVIDPIRGDDGRLIGFAKITRDITERRDAQMALERVQQQLAESQKMDALGQLTGGVAHDFNNLLMVVSGHIQTLKKIVVGDPKGTRAARAIEHAAERGATLTGQLLTFARRARVNPQPIDVHARVNAIREVLTSGLGRNIGFAIDVAADIWPVTVDIGEFEIALVNLVINARDAMPDGGTVTITARNVKLAEGEPAPPGEYVAICVEDTGVGIPDDIRAKVFEPFFTTKEIGKGTGLGLSQVHGFVHQAGGTVKIDSQLGEGTILTIYLPRPDTSVSVAADAPIGEAQPSGVVLLVEDNPDVASASTGLLEQLGYSVKWVPNAEAALEAIEANGFNLVFSDIVMPGRMDGLGLARIVRQRYPRLPILLATGYSEAAQNVQADFPILRKPYRLNELSQALARLGNG
jgi:PAS domain S-box-containing protein